MPIADVFQSASSHFSKSLTASPWYHTRMQLPTYTLRHSKSAVYIQGSVATVEFMSSLRIPWGETPPTQIESLQAGWQWFWHVPERQLEVHKPTGEIAWREAQSWASLGVSIEVLESAQFYYTFPPSPDEVPSAEYVPARMSPHNHSAQAKPYPWGPEGWNLVATGDAIKDRDARTQHAQGSKYVRTLAIVHCLDGVIPHQPLEISIERTLAYKANLPMRPHAGITNYEGKGGLNNGNIVAGIGGQVLSRVAAPSGLSKAARLTKAWNILFWANATASLFLGDDFGNRPCYEPWMLWGMWKYVQELIIADVSEKIFDLSPNWGNT